MTALPKHRFDIEWTLQGQTTVLLSPDATEEQVERAFREEFYKELRRSTGSLAAMSAEITIDRWEGPY